MRVALGADHAGYPLKDAVRKAIEDLGHEVVDRGTDGTAPVDFPDITRATCEPVLTGEADRAVLVCATGQGAIMAANKLPGIRCGLAHEPYSAHQAVEHDDANAIAMGAWLVPHALIPDIVREFLGAAFDDDEDTRRRVRKLNAPADLHRRMLRGDPVRVPDVPARERRHAGAGDRRVHLRHRVHPRVPHRGAGLAPHRAVRHDHPHIGGVARLPGRGGAQGGALS